MQLRGRLLLASTIQGLRIMPRIVDLSITIVQRSKLQVLTRSIQLSLTELPLLLVVKLSKFVQSFLLLSSVAVIK